MDVVILFERWSCLNTIARIIASVYVYIGFCFATFAHTVFVRWLKIGRCLIRYFLFDSFLVRSALGYVFDM